MSKIIFLLKAFFGLFVIILVALVIRYFTWLPDPYQPTMPINTSDIPKFQEVPVNFTHTFNKELTLPFMGAAVFDMRGDGKQYLFVGGGYNQPDKLFVFEKNKLVDISKDSGLTKDENDTTYGVASVDTNNNGLIDLFVARDSGVYLYTNKNGKYIGKKLDIPLDEKSTPLSIAVADLRKNGLADLFISTYIKRNLVEGQSIFNKQKYGSRSLLLLNNGDNTFTDITKSAGLDYVHNTFQAAFIDLDNSGELDLVVAYDTGHVKTFKNMGNLKFKDIPNPTTDVYSYPMGIAVGDYNNTGRPDLFFSNIGPFQWKSVGASPPNIIVRGDLRPDQTLLRTNIFLQNEGDFKFKNVADETKTADYGFGWGTIFQDFNNDGLLDIALAQNYIGFPPHKLFKLPSRLLMQLPNHTFAAVEKQAGAADPYYAISPLVADFNGNGYPDLVYLNLDGPLRLLLNQGGSNHYLKIIMPNKPDSVGAKVTVELANKTLTGFFVPTQGLCTYQTNTLFFGLGKETEIKKITIQYMNGRKQVFSNRQANITLNAESL